jgi:hypothetical protein
MVAAPGKRKRAITGEVMALGYVAGFRIVGWLHHPVRVGTLMPTPIRTRLRASLRNMLG